MHPAFLGALFTIRPLKFNGPIIHTLRAIATIPPSKHIICGKYHLAPTVDDLQKTRFNIVGFDGRKTGVVQISIWGENIGHVKIALRQEKIGLIEPRK